MVDLAVGYTAYPAGEEVSLGDVTLLAPVRRPGKIICTGLNYRAHVIEGGNPIPDYPAVFMHGPASLIGPDGDILYPEVSEQLDYETELAA